jgi:transposase
MAFSKGRVERAIQYARGSFFAARSFTTLADFNHQALQPRGLGFPLRRSQSPS